MPKTNRRKHDNLFTSPGTLAYVGPDIDLATVVQRIQYSPKDFSIERIAQSQYLLPNVPLEEKEVVWYNVEGIHNPEIIDHLGDRFHIHPLILEDIVNTNQKTKLEWFENDLIFIVLKQLRYADVPSQTDSSKLVRKLTTEHISIVLRNNLVLTFQEEVHGDTFLTIKERIKASVGKTRTNGADYLLFALMDVIVDTYFNTLNELEEHLDDIEDEIIKGSDKYKLRDIYNVKRDLSTLRKVIYPLRDLVAEIIRNQNNVIHSKTIPYFRDLYDHILQVIDSVDTHRELLTSLVDLHLSSMSNRMNEVMKTLTIFSAIFMPLTFIVGVYGMNFVNMPELAQPYGYYIVWGFMIVVSSSLFAYFKWKKWL